MPRLSTWKNRMFGFFAIECSDLVDVRHASSLTRAPVRVRGVITVIESWVRACQAARFKVRSEDFAYSFRSHFHSKASEASILDLRRHGGERLFPDQSLKLLHQVHELR